MLMCRNDNTTCLNKTAVATGAATYTLTFLDTAFSYTAGTIGSQNYATNSGPWTAATSNAAVTSDIDAAGAGNNKGVVLLFQLDNSGNNLKQINLFASAWNNANGAPVAVTVTSKVTVDLIGKTINVDFAGTVNTICSTGYNIYFKEMQGGLTAVSKKYFTGATLSGQYFNLSNL
jgi:hypothetical protein